MGLKDIDLNKDGVTLGDHIDNVKKSVKNMFDGDDSNSDNIIDRAAHQMNSSIVDSKIDELIPGDKKTK